MSETGSPSRKRERGGGGRERERERERYSPHGRDLDTNPPELLLVNLRDLVGVQRHQTKRPTSILEIVDQLERRANEVSRGLNCSEDVGLVLIASVSNIKCVCTCNFVFKINPTVVNPLSTDGHYSGHLAKLIFFFRIGKFNSCTYTTLI